jgi:hypothetical protein
MFCYIDNPSCITQTRWKDKCGKCFGNNQNMFCFGTPAAYQNLSTKKCWFWITNQHYYTNLHWRSEKKIANTSLTGTKPTYDEIQKKFGMYLVCSVSQICRYVGCLRVDLLFLRSVRTAFFDMRICSHIGPKLACRRPGTKYCVDLFFISEHFGTLPPLCVIFFR